MASSREPKVSRGRVFWLTLLLLCLPAVVTALPPERELPPLERAADGMGGPGQTSASGPAGPSAAGGTAIRVQLKPVRGAMLASPMSGIVERMTVKDGERFDAGASLVRLNCGVQNGELAQARAEYEKKAKVAETVSGLYALKSKSTLDLAVAKAEAAEAAAKVQVMKALVARCGVQAPFAGVAGEVFARQHQWVREGEPLLEVIDDSAFELECIVPSVWTATLKPGRRFTVTIDETGRSYQAEVARLGGRVDPVSQSIKVYGRMSRQDPALMAGMSGVAVFDKME